MIKNKPCTECGVIKPLNDFYDRLNKKGIKCLKASHCKSCMKKSRKEYCLITKEKRKSSMHVYYENNKAKCNKRNRGWSKDNKEKIALYKKERLKNTSLRKSENMVNAFNMWLKSKNKNSCYVVDYMGMTMDGATSFIESKFKKGMNWKNYGRGGWTIDHIVPRIRFDHTKESEIKKCWSPSNIQCLWEKENWSKGSKQDTQV